MLILTRRFGEKIVIGDNIVVTVIKGSNNKVSLGIDAPETLSIYREEIYKRLQAENLVEDTLQAQSEYQMDAKDGDVEELPIERQAESLHMAAS